VCTLGLRWFSCLLKKELSIVVGPSEILQILGIMLFERVSVHTVPTEVAPKTAPKGIVTKLLLFNS